MPELPEVETVCRGLRPKLEGHVLTSVIQRRPDLRFPIPAGFADRLRGHRVEKLGRRAKFIIATMDDATVLIAHLGMSGRMTIHDGPPPPHGPHDHVEFVTDAGCTVRFCDPRRFGLVDLTTTGALADHRMLRDLGPEPLSDDFTPAHLDAALAGKRTPIKAALLDQKVVAGLGNIYVCEALFRARLSPKRQASTIADRNGKPNERARALVDAIKATLNDAIKAGGSSLRDHRRADGSLGDFQHNFQVYNREGEPCPHCKGKIKRIVQTGRSTFYCPACQK
jgi:formamidopyrimidine-DNA glycosylase